ncbi:hypothetical protein G6O69_38365 [Pseudenhygromyxa sp. WMMC2535]|uniref:hypothetical protein n=1 Tax=Pseudenhygromyxa sp. WMMC2535 TaxID=2712867 RepID=UPI001551CAC1|nr:hypothetical protein [Pseudenhygromyxa sp. WMMC2535]NVB36227.1 hypothetical protein [Pseudenhygromyxa sp. WMMC2535]NVB43730.1 hypothetical protein [Pseudenhygromyxa sp. WMMC2535]
MIKNTTLILAFALGLLLPASALASLPDLCDDVYLDEIGAPVTDSEGTRLSRFCQWTGPDAPLWADHVCCSIGASASCTATDENGRCTTGIKMWCDYGEQINGEVVCYQPFDDACDRGFCDDLAPSGSDLVYVAPLCCFEHLDACYELSIAEYCGGFFLNCDSPYSNSDGTVGCGEG